MVRHVLLRVVLAPLFRLILILSMLLLLNEQVDDHVFGTLDAVQILVHGRDEPTQAFSTGASCEVGCAV